MNLDSSKLYIAVLDKFPDYMTPTLVAHAILNAHLEQQYDTFYIEWLKYSFKKCVVRVNQKEFDKICALPRVYIGREKHTLEGKDSCAVVCPLAAGQEYPNVIKFAKLWKPSTILIGEFVENCHFFSKNN